MKSANDWGQSGLKSDEKLAPVVHENTEDEKLSAVLRETRNTIARNSSDNFEAFEEIISIIRRARDNAYRAVNRELISMYWDVGRYISDKVKQSGWGKSIVKEFAKFMQTNYPDIKGFSSSNIWRMRQFYDTYNNNEKLATLLREITWSNNLQIMAKSKSEEEREFYLVLTSKNRYSFRELERQLNSLLYERTMISNEINKDTIMRSPGLSILRDQYILEFLDVPKRHKEKVFRKAIIANLRDFILEFGKDFHLLAMSTVFKLAITISILIYSFIIVIYPVLWQLS